MRRNNPPASLAIRSLSENPTLELLHALQERTERDHYGLYLAEGIRALHAAVTHQAPIVGIATCRELLHSAEARRTIQELNEKGIPLLKITTTQFLDLARAAEPQGVLLIFRQQWQPLPDKVHRKDLWLGIERIRTPGNLGTLIRSAMPPEPMALW